MPRAMPSAPGRPRVSAPGNVSDHRKASRGNGRGRPFLPQELAEGRAAALHRSRAISFCAPQRTGPRELRPRRSRSSAPLPPFLPAGVRPQDEPLRAGVGARREEKPVRTISASRSPARCSSAAAFLHRASVPPVPRAPGRVLLASAGVALASGGGRLAEPSREPGRDSGPGVLLLDTGSAAFPSRRAYAGSSRGSRRRPHPPTSAPSTSSPVAPCPSASREPPESPTPPGRPHAAASMKRSPPHPRSAGGSGTASRTSPPSIACSSPRRPHPRT